MVETIYRLPGAPRLALLADLHGRPYDLIISSLVAHHPSLVCLAGDFIYGSWPEGDRSPLETQELVLPFFRACASIAPTYFSLGNHEQMLDDADLAAIRSTGVVVLDNEWREIEVSGKRIVIGGLTSAYVTDYKAFRDTQDGAVRYPRKENLSGIGGAVTASQHQPDTAWLEGFAAVPGFHILLSHHPEYFPLIPPTIDLMLSGHAHGGQWRVFKHGIWCPGQGFWPIWTKGVYEGRLVVSAGLSNTASVPRLFNPCEVVFVEGD